MKRKSDVSRETFGLYCLAYKNFSAVWYLPEAKGSNGLPINPMVKV